MIFFIIEIYGWPSECQNFHKNLRVIEKVTLIITKLLVICIYNLSFITSSPIFCESSFSFLYSTSISLFSFLFVLNSIVSTSGSRKIGVLLELGVLLGVSSSTGVILVTWATYTRSTRLELDLKKLHAAGAVVNSGAWSCSDRASATLAFKKCKRASFNHFYFVFITIMIYPLWYFKKWIKYELLKQFFKLCILRK